MSQKIAEGLQKKVAKEASKYDRPVKLKVLTDRDMRKMKSQFAIFFEEPKTKAKAVIAASAQFK